MSASSRILIVDDHASVRDGIRAFLEARTNFTVCGEAEDGIHAIQQAKLLKPDLIILDLSMPKLNGVETASVIRGELPSVKIVAFSMFASELGKAIRSAARIDAVLPKSSGLKELVETIENVLRVPPPFSVGCCTF
jgi:DNA-binding NarL/FixJ family response regulator